MEKLKLRSIEIDDLDYLHKWRNDSAIFLN